MTLEDFFAAHKKTAVAFSGGIDSAYLVYAAKKYGADLTAYFVKTAFQPQSELDDAIEFAADINAELRIIEVDIMSYEDILKNPADRCYHCKKKIFSAVKKAASADGYSVILDGTNASDDIADRPGIRALNELCVISPLREYGITKDEIRALSRNAGIKIWDKPSYACLATRIPTGTAITADMLKNTERAEKELAAIGFSDFRIRYIDGAARIQVRDEQMEKLFKMRGEIIDRLKPYYKAILLDLGGRQ